MIRSNRWILRLQPLVGGVRCLSGGPTILGDSLLRYKATDRTHRNLYADLIHKKAQYGQAITIEPTFRHFLVMLKQENEHPEASKIPVRSGLPSPFKSTRLLEPIIFHILLCLRNLSLPDHQVQQQNEFQLRYLNSFLRAMKVQNVESLSDELTKYSIDLEKDLDYLVHQVVWNKRAATLLHSPTLQAHRSTALLQTLPSQTPLYLALACFHLISLKFKGLYNINDLVHWLRSFTSPNISSSCESLTNLTNIPPCILIDIIQRTPSSKVEYNLQMDLWLQYLPIISASYFNKVSQLKSCIDNLLYYGVKYQPSSVPLIIEKTFDHMLNNKSLNFTFINIEYINELIWELSRFTLLQRTEHRPFVKGHEILVRILTKLKPKESSKTYQLLSLRANMGIVFTLSGNPRANLLLEMAEKRFFTGDHALSNMDLVSYNAAKILLSRSPEELLEAFNNSHKFSNSSLLWLVFLRKLDEFELLNEIRAIKVAGEILKSHSEAVITNSVLTYLLKPFKGIKKLSLFLDNLPRPLLERHTDTILPVYIAMLYRNHNSTTLRETYYPWDDTSKNGDKRVGTFKGFPTVQAYARHLYNTCFPRKNMYQISVMLQGEAITNAQSVYDLYEQELSGSTSGPNEGCLLGLIRASMKPSKTGECIVWGNLYAPQVAIHEFKQYVKHSPDDDGLLPSNAVWQQYIRMLKKFEYTPELAELIEWWESIRFKPSKQTLLYLLTALPSEHAMRQLKHFEKIQAERKIKSSESKWRWPSVEEFERFKDESPL